MYIVTLKFSVNKSNAPQFMEGHKAWIEQGIKDGVFALVGSLPDIGGGIIAHNVSRDELEQRVKDDPFVAEQVVTADIMEFLPNRADERLSFLLPQG
ncbi:YciI family protein [Litoribrevibacter albus]|uniref:YCII-related domain-containing protein n=1 Tax=Litoribrevibacter albus TaxID=1473156 RepID=A0AA37S799_9GAMM|nr:hypothetical protein [Litoribrevibacter albus]GLQ30420.1 hypothetical protein GCM10007876_08980 [Litoribrevibacter albus]